MKKLVLAFSLMAVAAGASVVFRHAWTSKPPLGTQINWTNPLTRTLVSLWAMEEGGGIATVDLVTRQPATTANGVGTAAWTTDGTSAPAMSFGGATALATSAGPTRAWSAGSFTVAVRALIGSTTTMFPWMGDNNVASTPGICYSCNATTSSVALITPGVGFNCTTATGAVSVGVWHTIVYVQSLNGANGCTMYVDGVASITSTSPTLVDSVTTQVIGARNSAALSPMTGSISWIGVWMRPLTAREVSSLSSEPYAMFVPMRALDVNAAAVVGGQKKRRVVGGSYETPDTGRPPARRAVKSN